MDLEMALRVNIVRMYTLMVRDPEVGRTYDGDIVPHAMLEPYVGVSLEPSKARPQFYSTIAGRIHQRGKYTTQ